MTCLNCEHYPICSLWATGDLVEEESHKYCFGNFTPLGLHATWATWEESGISEYKKCSHCGILIKKEDLLYDPQWHLYCGHCGAKMKGVCNEQKEEKEEGSNLH